ncbi:uncharacterized protein LOC136026434 isoform X2 [Artemia franciscana]|uniref:uncharacterized protein LOC136026434 isoform X2 n=1 Tax=Artemia franciscana TaxID=6661 RepID=UPI0032DB1B35
MGDNNRKQFTVDDAPTVFETLRREKDSKITQKIPSPTAKAFSKSILPHRLRDKSHDLWLHPSVKFLSDSVGDDVVLPTTQNSGSNEGHVEVHSINTTESSDVIQEIRFKTKKLQDSTDQANWLRFVDTQETEAGVTCGTMQTAFGNPTLLNTPPKWFLEYMEAFKRDLFERSAAQLDKIEEKLEKFVAILVKNPVLAANIEENTVKTANVSTENQNFVGCGSYSNTNGLLELQKPPAQLNIFSCSSPEKPGGTIEFVAKASPRKRMDEPVVTPEFIQDTLVTDILHVEHQGTVESPISMDALQEHTDNILLIAASECLNKQTVATDDPLGSSKEIPDNGKHPLTSIACPHGCGTAGLTKEGIETHIKESCSALTVNCSFEKVECEFKGTQHTIEKHEEESTRHHLGLMCSFAERQHLELAKLQSQIEVQSKDKKNSASYIQLLRWQCLQCINLQSPSMLSALPALSSSSVNMLSCSRSFTVYRALSRNFSTSNLVLLLQDFLSVFSFNWHFLITLM